MTDLEIRKSKYRWNSAEGRRLRELWFRHDKKHGHRQCSPEELRNHRHTVEKLRTTKEKRVIKEVPEVKRYGYDFKAHWELYKIEGDKREATQAEIDEHARELRHELALKIYGGIHGGGKRLYMGELADPKLIKSKLTGKEISKEQQLHGSKTKISVDVHNRRNIGWKEVVEKRIIDIVDEARTTIKSESRSGSKTSITRTNNAEEATRTIRSGTRSYGTEARTVAYGDASKFIAVGGSERKPIVLSTGGYDSYKRKEYNETVDTGDFKRRE